MGRPGGSRVRAQGGGSRRSAADPERRRARGAKAARSKGAKAAAARSRLGLDGAGDALGVAVDGELQWLPGVAADGDARIQHQRCEGGRDETVSATKHSHRPPHGRAGGDGKLGLLLLLAREHQEEVERPAMLSSREQATKVGRSRGGGEERLPRAGRIWPPSGAEIAPPGGSGDGGGRGLGSSDGRMEAAAASTMA